MTDGLGIRLDDCQPSMPPAKSNIDYSHEASEYEQKLIQVSGPCSAWVNLQMGYNAYLLTYAYRSPLSIGHQRPLTITLCSGLLWSFWTSWSLAVSALLRCLASNCCEAGLSFSSRPQCWLELFVSEFIDVSLWWEWEAYVSMFLCCMWYDSVSRCPAVSCLTFKISIRLIDFDWSIVLRRLDSL